MWYRRKRRMIGFFLLLLACLLFGVFYAAAAAKFEKLFKGDDRRRPRFVENAGLYMACSTQLHYGQDLSHHVQLDSLKVGVSLSRGGFAQLFFERDGAVYDSFCISRSDDIPSGFYRHRPGARSRLLRAADLAAVSLVVQEAAEFQDEKYNSMDLMNWDRMPIELARHEKFQSIEVEVRRRDESLVAFVNGRDVATLDNADRFFVGKGLSAGVAAGRFPGCFVKEVFLSGVANGRPYRAGKAFLRSNSAVAKIGAILKGAGVALAYWILSTILLRRLIVKKNVKAGLFEGVVVAIVGTPVLLAGGPGSITLVAIFVVMIWFGFHAILLLGCGGLHPLSLPEPDDDAGPKRGRHRIPLLVGLPLALAGVAVVLWVAVEASDYRWNFKEGYLVDHEIVAEVTLEPDTVAEFYFRKREDDLFVQSFRIPAPPHWYAFRLSSLPGEGCRFVSSMGPERQVATAQPLPAGRYRIRLEIIGSTFTAYIDDRLVDRFTDETLSAGWAGYVTRQGHAVLHRWDTPPTGWGTGRRRLRFFFTAMLPLLVLAILVFARTKAPARRAFVFRCGIIFLPLAVAGAVVVTLPRIAPRFLATFPPPGKAAELFASLRELSPLAMMAVGAALSVAALILLVVQNHNAIVWRKGLLALLTLAFLWHLNEYAAQTNINRSIKVYLRPGGYITQSHYRIGTLSPKEVWDHYSNRFNFRGRGASVSKRKSAGTRVVVLGGSSTWGLGAEPGQAYPAILQRILPQDHGSYEILNGGAPGWTSAMARPFLEGLLLEYEPDYIVFNFGYNDAALWAPLSHKDAIQKQKEGGALVSVPWALPAAVNVFAQAFSSTSITHGVNKAMVPYDHFEQNVNRLLTLRRKHGFKVILVSEPFDWAEGYASGPLRAPYYRLMETLAAANDKVEYIDAHQLFHERALDDLMVDRVHHSPEGNRVLAEVLKQKILEMQSR